MGVTVVIALERMSRLIALALVVALAAVVSSSPNIGTQNPRYLGFGFGGQYGYNPYNNFNQAWYPNMQPGYGFYGQLPAQGYGGCQYWCRSWNSQYYCCTTGNQYYNQGSFGNFGNFGNVWG